MRTFHVCSPDTAILDALSEKVDNLTKPKGSLGRLEELAVQIGWIQQTLTPRLSLPQNIIFAADHGILSEGVSPTPREVTYQQTINFCRGTSGINFLCRQHGFRLKVVDAGVDHDLPQDLGIIDLKIRRGTSNFAYGPAMSEAEFGLCLERGAGVVEQCHAEGTNLISIGEMGAGNTSPSSLWMHLLTGIALPQCVGAGSGLSGEGISHKLQVLQRALDHYQGDGSLADELRWFGGFELAMAVGAMLRAAELKMTILIDGFIMTACLLAAQALQPAVKDYAIFGHCGDEAGHRLLLDYLGARPLLNLGLRLGEGSGAVCAFPIVDSAVRMLNEMDSFNSTPITKYF